MYERTLCYWVPDRPNGNRRVSNAVRRRGYTNVAVVPGTRVPPRPGYTRAPGMITCPVLRNSASGPEIKLSGRISAGFVGKTSKLALRPAYGRSGGRFRCFPAELRPGSPISGPQALSYLAFGHEK